MIKKVKMVQKTTARIAKKQGTRLLMLKKALVEDTAFPFPEALPENNNTQLIVEIISDKLIIRKMTREERALGNQGGTQNG